MLTLKGVPATVVSAGLLRGRRPRAGGCSSLQPLPRPGRSGADSAPWRRPVSERGRPLRGGCAVLNLQRVRQPLDRTEAAPPRGGIRAAGFSRKGLDTGCPVAESGPGRPARWPWSLVLTQALSRISSGNLMRMRPRSHIWRRGPGLLHEPILKRTFYSCVGIKMSMFISYMETFSST